MRKYLKNKISIIIPTFNEAENIVKLIEQIILEIEHKNFEIFVVDDGSSDQTVQNIFSNFENEQRVKVIQREHDKGLLQSIKFALQSINGEFFLVMDGDGQHSAKDMIKLINNLKDNDLVIGSRDLNKTKSINPVRIFFSKIFNFILKFILSVKLRDPLTGFFAGRINLLNRKFFLLNTSGFKILLDLLFCNKNQNIKISEEIIDFKERIAGSSKLNLQIVFSFFTQVLSYFTNGLISSKFIGFVMIGSIGLIVHFAILFNCLNLLNFSFILSHAMATILSASFNFVLNNYLNFVNNEITEPKLFIKSLFKYYLVNIPGILLSISGASFVYDLILKNVFIASLSGAILDAVFKYAISTTWIWRSK